MRQDDLRGAPRPCELGGPAALPLADGEIHLWLVLDQGTPPWPGADSCLGMLSPEERRRADSFVLREHGLRYAAGRSRLRAILGRYLARDPRSLRLEPGPHGKPYLAEKGPAGGLFFNASHSGDAMLVAVTRLGDVGVDIERHRPLPEWRGIARACFPREECLTLELLPEPRALGRFFEAWTLHEARLKALGLGLGGAEQLSRGLAFGTTVSWNPLPGYAGALVVAGARARARRISAFRFRPPRSFPLPDVREGAQAGAGPGLHPADRHAGAESLNAARGPNHR